MTRVFFICIIVEDSEVLIFMSEALKSFNLIKSKLLSLLDYEEEDSDEIEEALKDYEETDNQLYDLFEKFGINNRNDLLKKIKAFEIINEKSVCIATLKDSNSLEEYNDVICYHKVRSMSLEKPLFLEQEEYELLKEVLLNE